jgi:fructokinase
MRIGLDLGGTKIEGVALGDDGAQLARRRVATPRHDYAATLEAMAGVVRDLEAETGRRGSVGVGMPGALSPATGLVKNANSTWLIGQPLDRDLSGLLGRKVRFANDANCFALSEAVDGAAAGARVVFGVIVGTGTGGGIVVDRKVLTGPNAIAGEWGHNPLPWPREGEWPGPACYCGKTGCVETFLSGPGMARDFRQVTGEDVAAPEIVARAERGDPAASATLGRYEERMARALAAVLNVLDPDAVVLGGGMSRIDRLYESVPRLWQEWAFSDRVDTILRPPVHGDSSGVRGAAWLWGAGEA